MDYIPNKKMGNLLGTYINGKMRTLFTDERSTNLVARGENRQNIFPCINNG